MYGVIQCVKMELFELIIFTVSIVGVDYLADGGRLNDTRLTIEAHGRSATSQHMV